MTFDEQADPIIEAWLRGRGRSMDRILGRAGCHATAANLLPDRFLHLWRGKRALGDGLGSRTGRRHESGVAIAIAVLNPRLELGPPEYVRVA